MPIMAAAPNNNRWQTVARGLRPAPPRNTLDTTAHIIRGTRNKDNVSYSQARRWHVRDTQLVDPRGNALPGSGGEGWRRGLGSEWARGSTCGSIVTVQEDGDDVAMRLKRPAKFEVYQTPQSCWRFSAPSGINLEAGQLEQQSALVWSSGGVHAQLYVG